VVSEYTQAGYVSGACSNGVCSNNTFPYQHDFGSILAFTDYNFNFNPLFIATPYYADFNALDWSPDHKTHVPLSDFFGLSNQRSFSSIPVVYQPDFYEDYYMNNSTYSPTGPDGDDAD
jgi:hypothetical protein